MNPHDRFAKVVERINALSSRTRNKQRELRREEAHGDPDALRARLEPIVLRLESLADEMEKALA